MEKQNQAVTIVAGFGICGLLVATLYQVPAWIPLLAVLVAGSIHSGFDFSISEQQIARRREEEQLKESFKRAPEQKDSEDIMDITKRQAYLKMKMLAKDKKRTELLKDLNVVGVDILPYEQMTYKQIMDDIDPMKLLEIKELRNFLK